MNNPRKPKGTPMSGKTRRSLIKRAAKRNLSEATIVALATYFNPGVTKAQVFGYHPTKVRKAA